jgi:general stress protein YciG
MQLAQRECTVVARNEEDAVDGLRKERRGFASMSPEKQREIASKGGRAAHEKGTAHEWTPDEARNAGRKGGQISRGGRGRLIPASAADVNVTGVSVSGAEPRRAD